MRDPLRTLFVNTSEERCGKLERELSVGGYEVRGLRVESRDAMGVALEQHAWDLILADFDVSGFSGFAPLELTRERGVEAPFIVIAAPEDEAEVLHMLNLGAHDYVLRGNLGRLMPTVQRGLREARERQVRRQAERALRDSEERYRELVENANDVVFTADLQGNFTSLNTAGEQFSGYTRHEVCRMNMGHVLTPESFEVAQRQIRQKLIGVAATTYELEVIARDGHIVTLEVSTRLMSHDGVPMGIQGIGRDITERKRVDRELRAREQKQAAVARFGLFALGTSRVADVFEEAVHCVTQTLDVPFSTVLEFLPEDDVLVARAGAGWDGDLSHDHMVGAGPESQAGYTLLTDQSIVVEDLQSEARFSVPQVLVSHGARSGISVIVHGDGRPFGVLTAFARIPRAFTLDDVNFLQTIANVMATAIERRRLERERAQHTTELATRVLQAQEEERKRIARELHDETAQSLSMLLTHLDLVEPHIPDNADQLRQGFVRIEALARRTLDETRTLSHDLRPSILDDAGLVAALQWVGADYEQTYRIAVHVEGPRDGSDAVGAEVKMALFRIAQEALQNSVKHSGATSATIVLEFAGGMVRLVIADDGKGFDLGRVPAPTREGRLGLYGMHERAELLGGTLTIKTAPGQGTRVEVEIPVVPSLGDSLFGSQALSR